MKFSVIIPCYNCEKFLPETLLSLEKQTYTDFEVICINDGSTDATLSVLEKRASRGITDIKIINKDNGGVSSARNLGIKNAKGEYLVFLDSDDLYHKDFLKILADAVDNNDTAYCRLTRNKSVLLKKADKKAVRQDKTTAYKNLLYRMGDFGFYCYVYKKSILEENEILFDEDIKFGEDREFNWKYLLCCEKIAFVDSALYFYRDNPFGAVNSRPTWRRTDSLLAIERTKTSFIRHRSGFTDEYKTYMTARDTWAVAKAFAISGQKDYFEKLGKEFDTKRAMKTLLSDKVPLVKLASALYLIRPELFYYAINSFGKLGKDKNEIKLCYAPIYNAGDLMNKDIVELLSGKETICSKVYDSDMMAIGGAIYGAQYSQNTVRKLLQIGMHFLYGKKPLHIWGSGFFINELDTPLYRNNLDVCALRGDNTRKKLEKLTGLDLSSVTLADAGLLVDMLLDEMPEKTHSVGLIPHLSQKDSAVFISAKNDENYFFIDISRTPQEVAKDIASCKTIASSSLHGLIFADSLHIPAVHLIVENGLSDGNFKFEDYYSAYGLSDCAWDTENGLPTEDDIKQLCKVDYELIDRLKEDLPTVFPYK